VGNPAALAKLKARCGAVLGTLHGQRVDLHYGDPDGEYRALVTDAGMVDVSASSRVELTGDDRAAFLNRMCTNRVDDLSTGEGREAFLTDAKGHVLAHVLVFAGADSLVLHAASGQADTVCRHLSRYVLRDRVALDDGSEAWAELLLTGRRSQVLLGRLTATGLPQALLEHREIQLAGISVSARRVDLSGPIGFLLSCDADDAGPLWHALEQRGARPCGRQAAEAVRIEAGWPVYGRDVTAENLPQEVGRNVSAISFTKGCYLGQETIARIDSRGHVNRALVGLRFGSTGVPPSGAALEASGRPVGHVTSAAFSPQWGSAVALGYVRRGSSAPGTCLDSVLGKAEVALLPMLPAAADSEEVSHSIS
jgi:folate-binding protein YgfZ